MGELNTKIEGLEHKLSMLVTLTRTLKAKLDEGTQSLALSQPPTGFSEQVTQNQKFSKSMYNPGNENEDSLTPSPNSQKNQDSFGTFFRKNKSLLHSTQMINTLKSKVDRMPTHQSLSVKTQGESDDNTPSNNYEMMESPSDFGIRKSFFNSIKQNKQEESPRESLLGNQDAKTDMLTNQKTNNNESDDEVLAKLDQNFESTFHPNQEENSQNEKDTGSRIKVEEF